MRLKILAAAACTSTFMISSPKANAYAIDCAILLCLAGGFPASSECTAAKIELIRRITPWPIEPPLQLWNCPMGMSGSRFNEINALLHATGQPLLSMPQVGADGLTPDTRRYRDAISLYHVRYERWRNSEGEEVRDYTRRGEYDGTGQFRWVAASLEEAPEWLSEAIGGERLPIRRCAETQRMGREDEYCVRYETVGYSFTPRMNVRAVAIRTMDHAGNYSVEVVHY